MNTTIETIVDSAREARSNYEPKTELKYMTVPAREVKAGDYLSGTTRGAGEKVEAVKLGTTKAHITVQGRKTPLAFDGSEEVQVGRQVQTEESIETQKALYAEHRALEWLAALAAEPTADIERMNELAAKGDYRRVAEYAIDLAGKQEARG